MRGQSEDLISAGLSDPAIVYIAGIVVAVNLLMVAAASSGSAIRRLQLLANLQRSLVNGGRLAWEEEVCVREGTGMRGRRLAPWGSALPPRLPIAADPGGRRRRFSSRLVPPSTSFPHQGGYAGGAGSEKARRSTASDERVRAGG